MFCLWEYFNISLKQNDCIVTYTKCSVKNETKAEL